MAAFAIGSKVVHPCYGAGTIDRIQEKSIAACSHFYYVISTVAKVMQIMVPVQRADDVGLRPVGKAADLRALLVTCQSVPPEGSMKSDLRKRQTAMREELKSGSFGQVADVVSRLYFLNQRRPLGTVDRQLYEQGKELLTSELSLAVGVEPSTAMEELEQNLAMMMATES